MDKALNESIRRVSELLEAHTARNQETSESVEGLVTVTLDARLQLTKVTLHDRSINSTHREALECAIVEAVNRAGIKAVKAAGESLGGLRDSDEWKRAMDQVFMRDKSRDRAS